MHLGGRRVGVSVVGSAMAEGVDELMDRAGEAMGRGDRAQALELIEAALLVDGHHVPALGAKGTLLGEDGDHEGALACYERVIEVAPKLGDAHYSRALSLERLGRIDEAVAAYGEAIALSPEDPDPLINRGRLRDDAGDAEAAIADYDAALAVAEDEVMAWSNRGNSLMALERFDEALASFDRALALDAAWMPAALGRSTSLLSLGRLEEANDARPVGTRLDRGEALERRRSLPDGTSLVVRWLPGRHTNPEFLEAAAESLLDTAAGLAERPPGLEDGVTISYGWAMLTVRHRGQDRILCEPAFSRHPTLQLAYDITFSLQTLVMHDMLTAIVNVEPSACLCMDLVAVQRGALAEPRVVMTRIAERDDGVSGWVIGPSSAEGIERMLEDEDYVMVPSALLATERPHLIKALLMPPAHVVTFEGHAVTSIRDERGTERFGVED